MPPSKSLPVTGGTVTSSRLFPATCADLWQAWVDPARHARWWGPDGFSNTVQEFDLRPGGAWKLTMHGPDDTEFHNEKVFTEVRPQERVVFRHLSPMHVFTMAMDFTPHAAGATLTWTMDFETPTSAELLKFISLANEQNFDRLAAHLRGEI